MQRLIIDNRSSKGIKEVLRFLSYKNLDEIVESGDIDNLIYGCGMLAGIKQNKQSITITVCDETDNIFEGSA